MIGPAHEEQEAAAFLGSETLHSSWSSRDGKQLPCQCSLESITCNALPATHTHPEIAGQIWYFLRRPACRSKRENGPGLLFRSGSH
jgi:hypothetical protein